MSKYVLVFGSKPDSKIPDIKVKKIYSANGAAERAMLYKEKYPNIDNELSVTNLISSQVLTLPLYPNMTNEEKNLLVNSVSEFFEQPNF